MTSYRVGVALLLVITFMLGGCGATGLFDGPTGTVSVQTADPDQTTVIKGDFDHALYSATDRDTLDLVLIAGPIDAPTQALHVQMFWAPKIGKTPTNRSSTNCSVRYAIFEGEHAAVYGGGGLVWPTSKVGNDSLKGVLVNATLRLVDASGIQGLAQTLGPVTIAEGSFNATRDDSATTRTLYRIQRQLKDRLDYPRFVDEPTTDEPVAVR